MMAKDPEQRLPSAAAVRHELLSWADKGSGLPLDRPEDKGYERAVTLLETEEPSSEQLIGEVLPADDEPPSDPPADETPSPHAAAEDPVPKVIPVGIPEPPRPRPRRTSTVVLSDTVPRPTPVKPPAAERAPWLLFALPIAAGIALGLIVLVVVWLVFLK